MGIRLQELNTPRLRLRRLAMKDLEHYFLITSSEAVTKYMLWKPHASLEESAASIRKTLARYETAESLRWAIALADTDELIGIIDVLGLDETRECCGFAYMLAEGFWNRGYGTEAVTAVFRYAFESLGVRAIEADHFSENPASGAVMRKAGMTPTGILAGKYSKNHRIHDAVQYRITKEEWKLRQR